MRPNRANWMNRVRRVRNPPAPISATSMYGPQTTALISALSFRRNSGMGPFPSGGLRRASGGGNILKSGDRPAAELPREFAGQTPAVSAERHVSARFTRSAGASLPAEASAQAGHRFSRQYAEEIRNCHPVLFGQNGWLYPMALT